MNETEVFQLQRDSSNLKVKFDHEDMIALTVLLHTARSPVDGLYMIGRKDLSPLESDVR